MKNNVIIFQKCIGVGVSEETCAFFEEFLPAQLTKNLQLATLQPLSTSYVSAELTSKFSDLVWRVQTTQGSIQICLLLEHKSYRDPHVVFTLTCINPEEFEVVMSVER